MKILHVITSMDPKRGGVSQAVRNIVLDNAFCQHEVVCMDDDNTDYNTPDEFKVYKIGGGKTSYQYNPAFKQWLRGNMAQYSHVVVHGIWQYHNLAAYQVCKKIKKESRPILAIMPHGMLDPYFQKASGRKIKALRNKLVWLTIEKKAVNFADALLFTCEEEKLLARQTFFGYKPKNELTVGLGVMPPPAETEIMHKAFKDKTGIKRPYWLFLSRLHPKKGIDLLIKAYTELSNENPDIPLLVVAGPIDDDYSNSMKNIAADNHNIVFTGMISGDIKWGAFYGCNMFILPSFQENFGIAIVEAMACSKPVAITRNINIWREIIDGQGGYIIEEQTIPAIKNVLAQINGISKNELEEKGKKAREAYSIYFNLEQCARQFINLLGGQK
jgi:glycosyltransferase involved in cell wall biosynthesis